MTRATWTRLGTDARREQLLALGLELFSRRPFDAISIDEIAQAAGVSRGLLYHYFPSKRDFYVAVVREALDELAALIAPDPQLAADAQLEAGLRAFLDYVVRRREGYLTVTQGGIGADPEVHELVEGARRRVVDLVVGGLGVHRPGPRLRPALRGWVGYVEGVVLAWLDGADLDADDVVELARATLAATAAAAGARPA